MIEASGLTKRYGTKLAVDDLSFQVHPGRVTGFLGPNGAGKSTSMRMIIGLDAPTAGTVTVGGRQYRGLPAPLRQVGSMLEARGVHGGRRAYHHLLYLARTSGIPRRRVDEVLEQVGLGEVGHQRAKGFSLGMAQRLGIAAALLGDPEILIFDEPVNGLDTEGIRWIRDLMRVWAAEGRTVFVSSHLMSEMELTADHLIVIGRGRLIADTSMRDYIETNSRAVTLVRSPEAERLASLLAGAGAQVRPHGDGGHLIGGPSATTIGDIAGEHRIVLHELTPQLSSLEDIYTEMTRASVEYRAANVPAGDPVDGRRRGVRDPWISS